MSFPRMDILGDVIERTEMRDGETYFVQCMSHGLIGIARPGSGLEFRCKNREEQGLIDALPLHGPDECPECRREEEREWRFYCDNIAPWEDNPETVAPWRKRAASRAEHDEHLDQMIDELAEEDHIDP